MNYATEYARSLADPVGFWQEQAALVDWYRAPRQILSQDTNGNDAWYADGQLNSAYLALDYHIQQGSRRAAGADLRFSCDPDHSPLYLH